MNRTTIRITIAALTLWSASAWTTQAQSWLIDFGNNTSFRGTNVVNPDSNGNFWNSVDSSVYWPGLIDQQGNATALGFGFSSAIGTDSLNGPAGTNTDPALVVIDATALGDLGINEAVFDWYSTSTFTIQGLNPTSTYNLTFFGSRMFSADEETIYTVYTSNDYSVAVTSTNLAVRDATQPWLHNSNNVVTIMNVSPQFADSLWIGYTGSTTNNGYLNALKIEVYAGPAAANEIPFTASTIASGEFQVRFVGENGIQYGLEFNQDLTDGAGWQTVLDGAFPVTASGDGITEVVLSDPTPTDLTRAYRLIRSP